MDCIVSLLRRLDLLGQDELANLGVIADEMEGAIDEDFESFMNWVKSGNLPPEDFTFEETCKPGTLSFSTMGTLRKSLSRASLRITSSPVVGAGFGSRLSLRSPYANRSVTSPRVNSLRDTHNHNTPTIHENQLSGDERTSATPYTVERNHMSNQARLNYESINETDENMQELNHKENTDDESIIDAKHLNKGTENHSESMETNTNSDIETPSKISTLNVYISQSDHQDSSISGSESPNKENGQHTPEYKSSQSNSHTRENVNSYDDRMNPFTEDFEEH